MLDASLPQDVRRDQPEHSLSLETAHIMRVSDVLCLSAVTIRSLVHAEGLDVRPSYSWVKRLLRGMRMRYKKPNCVKEVHAASQHAAALHRAVLADRQAADRVVNIAETSCRLLPVHQIGWGRRGVKQAQLQSNAKEATTLTIAFSMDRGPLDMLLQIVQAGKTDAVLLEQPWPERTHHVTSENG